MAIIKSPVEMIGSIQGFSFYKLIGSERVIARTKGGASRQKIRNSPNFATVRLHQSEWAGSVKMSRTLCLAMHPVKHLADFNVPAYLNGFSKKLQALDTENPTGARKIELSRYKYLLDDFQLDRIHTFAGILRVSPSWEIIRETMEAQVNIPYINTDIHLVNPMNLPYFRIIAVLGLAADMFVDPETRQYTSAREFINGGSTVARSEWYSTNRVIEAQEMTLKFNDPNYSSPDDDISLLLSIGVEFGKAGFDNQPVEVRHAGGAKILGVR